MQMADSEEQATANGQESESVLSSQNEPSIDLVSKLQELAPIIRNLSRKDGLDGTAERDVDVKVDSEASSNTQPLANDALYDNLLDFSQITPPSPQRNILLEMGNTPIVSYCQRTPILDIYMTREMTSSSEAIDKVLEGKLIKRIHEIVPSVEHKLQFDCFVAKVNAILRFLQLPASTDSCRINAVEMVGPYRCKTLLEGNLTADFIVTMDTLPIKPGIAAFANRLLEELKTYDPSHQVNVQFREEVIEIFDVYQPHDKICIHFATSATLIATLGVAHIKKQTVKQNLETLQHTKWFDFEAIQFPNVVNLICLVSDIAERFKDLQVLTPWTITVLSHFSISHTTDGKPLPLASAFRRFFTLISSGILSTSSGAVLGIPDPVRPNQTFVGSLPLADCISVSKMAQLILNIIDFEPRGIHYILALRPIPLLTDLSSIGPDKWDKLKYEKTPRLVRQFN